MGLWHWIGELAPAQATVFGTTVGAVLGFGTLASGALLNAHLNRKRDLYLHQMQQLNLLRSLVIEITQISNLVRNQSALLEGKDAKNETVSLINPSTLAVVYRNNLANLNLVPPQALIRIIPFYTGLLEHEYNVETYGGRKVGKGDELRLFSIEPQQVSRILELNKRLDTMCQQTLEKCWPLTNLLEQKLEGTANTIKPVR